MKKRIINRLAVEESIQILEDGRQLDIAHACVVVDVLKACLDTINKAEERKQKKILEAKRGSIRESVPKSNVKNPTVDHSSHVISIDKEVIDPVCANLDINSGICLQENYVCGKGYCPMKKSRRISINSFPMKYVLPSGNEIDSKAEIIKEVGQAKNARYLVRFAGYSYYYEDVLDSKGSLLMGGISIVPEYLEPVKDYLKSIIKIKET